MNYELETVHAIVAYDAAIERAFYSTDISHFDFWDKSVIVLPTEIYKMYSESDEKKRLKNPHIVYGSNGALPFNEYLPTPISIVETLEEAKHKAFSLVENEHSEHSEVVILVKDGECLKDTKLDSLDIVISSKKTLDGLLVSLILENVAGIDCAIGSRINNRKDIDLPNGSKKYIVSLSPNLFCSNECANFLYVSPIGDRLLSLSGEVGAIPIANLISWHAVRGKPAVEMVLAHTGGLTKTIRCNSEFHKNRLVAELATIYNMQ